MLYICITKNTKAMQPIKELILTNLLAFKEMRFQKWFEGKQEIFHHTVEIVDTDIIYLELTKN